MYQTRPKQPTSIRFGKGYCQIYTAFSAQGSKYCILTTVRTIPPAIASVLEQLELDQPLLVSADELKRARETTESTTTTRYLIDELTANGWLLPLRTRGIWEFAPASRAGAVGAGDVHIELRATLRKRPDLPVALAAESAAWLHGLSARTPTRDALSAPTDVRLPPALHDYRVIRAASKLGPEVRNGLPVWRVATLLAAMAHRPSSYRDWPNVGDWLSDAAARISEADLRVELVHEPRSTWVRLAYLLDRGGQPDLAQALECEAPDGSGPYYLGTRDRRGRYDRRYDVIDSALVDFRP